MLVRGVCPKLIHPRYLQGSSSSTPFTMGDVYDETQIDQYEGENWKATQLSFKWCFYFLGGLLSACVFLDACKFGPMYWSTCCVILGWTNLSNSGGSATMEDKKECSWGCSGNHTNNRLSPRNSLCHNDHLNNSLWKLWAWLLMNII